MKLSCMYCKGDTLWLKDLHVWKYHSNQNFCCPVDFTKEYKLFLPTQIRATGERVLHQCRLSSAYLDKNHSLASGCSLNNSFGCQKSFFHFWPQTSSCLQSCSPPGLHASATLEPLRPQSPRPRLLPEKLPHTHIYYYTGIIWYYCYYVRALWA